MKEIQFPAPPELFEIMLSVTSLASGCLPLANGYQTYALFLNIIRGSSPELAEKLHRDEAVKPFTVSPLLGKIDRRKAELVIKENEILKIRLTFLNAVVFSHFMDGALRWGEKSVMISKIPFRVAQVNTNPRPGAFCASQELTQNAAPNLKLDVNFNTPTVFRSKGKRNSLFPEPVLVFTSWFNKWNETAPLKLNEELKTSFADINITRYQLQSAVWDFGNYQEVGFTGKCRFELPHETAPESARALNALAVFGQFCGTGAKTTMGMGQTEIVTNGGVVPSGTGSDTTKTK